jgi:hypothetical protein
MPLPGGILALDLSSVTGWCYGNVGDNLPIFGTWRLPHIGGEGARYGAFENELIAALERWEPGRMILEAPMAFGALLGHSNFRTMAQQYTLRGISYKEGWRASCEVTEIDAYSVRHEVLGQGRFAKETVKREVVRYCRHVGLRVPDHNAGDACLTWLWKTARMRGVAPVAGPLFQKVRVGV